MASTGQPRAAQLQPGTAMQVYTMRSPVTFNGDKSSTHICNWIICACFDTSLEVPSYLGYSSSKQRSVQCAYGRIVEDIGKYPEPAPFRMTVLVHSQMVFGFVHVLHHGAIVHQLPTDVGLIAPPQFMQRNGHLRSGCAQHTPNLFRSDALVVLDLFIGYLLYPRVHVVDGVLRDGAQSIDCTATSITLLVHSPNAFDTNSHGSSTNVAVKPGIVVAVGWIRVHD